MSVVEANSEAVLYSKYNCSQCDQSKALLKKLNIPYSEINVEDHPEVLDFLKAEGFLQAPVIMTDSDSWSGFQPDKIKSLLKRNETATDDDWDW